MQKNKHGNKFCFHFRGPNPRGRSFGLIPEQGLRSGNKALFLCPYHAWSYGTNGELMHVPFGEEGFANCDEVHVENRNLIEVPAVEKGAPELPPLRSPPLPVLLLWRGIQAEKTREEALEILLTRNQDL